ncbi:SIMPL domain-containing protein [Sediminicoccus sp. KRV36]|uniref:SIMPL domain-containing protein n=1 Tax=Sediminicoccus sp. KRV36 TaxID=3133721 RepID=UPI00200CBA79|nr:SIMPL domain-containing protein [Sediminicoccus rosea]UPY38594.1 SIMPL domain-containing protein [Sediminicoccus rosea]
MIRPLLLLAALILPLSAMAQSETRLRVSETGSVAVPPDELIASLRIEARADTAAEAQEQVNRAMAAALTAARAVPGARVTNGQYAARTDRDKQEVIAQQSLNLRGPEALVALVGRLQADGLLLDQISWQLSPAAARQGRDDATRAAIRSVQERGAAIARDLGLRVSAMRDLYVEAAPEGQPMMMSARAASATAPSVTAEDITVTARVTADLLLRR